jgi:hypothetical protein
MVSLIYPYAICIIIVQNKRSKKMNREREIEIIKEWYALPGFGKKGEVLDHECEWLLDSLEEQEEGIRGDKKMKRDDAIKLMDDKVVTLTARDKEEYYKESKAHREKHKIPMERENGESEIHCI